MGTAFARIIVRGFIGDTSNTSMVPFLLRAIEIEVIMAQISMRIIPITPGTVIATSSEDCKAV